MASHEDLLREAVRLAQSNRDRGARPFGAVLTLDGAVIATGVNNVVHSHDPTTHAELEALRLACRRLGRPDVKGGIVYASGHPCPMCLAALVMCGVETVYYAFDNRDAAPFGFSSEAAYRALRMPLTPAPLRFKRLDLGIPPEAVYGPPATHD